MMRSFSVLLVLAVMIFLIQVIPPSVSVISDEPAKLGDDHHVEELHGIINNVVRDWRANGVVTPVKDQRNCSVCWAFAAVASVESAVQIAGKTWQPISLSEQEIIDCDWTSKGCNCGDPKQAFNRAKYLGLVAEFYYPYQGVNGSCKPTYGISRTRITDFFSVLPRMEWALQKAVDKGPVSVGIMTTTEFGEHKGDVILRASVCLGKTLELNHAVTVVGYGTITTTGTNYWIIKNSWGENWGLRGYGFVEKDVGIEGGFCGIALDAVFPIVI